MSCRDCEHLIVEPDRDGTRRVRRDRVYPCVAPVPEVPDLPHSVTRYLSFNWPPRRTWMLPERGESCPSFTKREKESCR